MTPKRASITRFRSIRRQRTTPSTAGIGAGLDNLAKFFHLDIAQVARPARALAVGEAIRSLFVEPVNPVPQGLAIHPTDPCGLSTAHAIVDRRKRQQTAALPGILATAGEFYEGGGHQSRDEAEHWLAWRSSFANLESDQNRFGESPQSQKLMPLV